MLTRYRLDIEGLNHALYQGFLEHSGDSDVRRTHLFGGRYENIYLTSDHIPALADLVSAVKAHAARELGRDDLRFGLWFNDMPPGAVTTLHNHDNEDELLSCVYYVRVPANSGDLVIHDDQGQHSITPEEGDLYCFAPGLDHEVTINNSDENRLSIAINFGPAIEDETPS